MESQLAPKRLNSTNSLYISNTLLSPNVNSIIQAIAQIIHSQIHEDFQNGREISKSSDLYFFSEEKYIEQFPNQLDQVLLQIIHKAPSVDNIFEFIKAIYDCAQFSIECCIISLIYINRIIIFTGLPLHSSNWRPLILCSLLVAQKVWDDQNLNNEDFSFIYPFFVTEEINILEQKFLELIQYRININSNIYTKYYFELRLLFKNQSEFPLTPLTIDKQRELDYKTLGMQRLEIEKAQRKIKTYEEIQLRRPNASINV